LLNRIVEKIEANCQDDEGVVGTFKLIEPQIARTKTKTTWINFDA
jgi:hypothetical protein